MIQNTDYLDYIHNIQLAIKKSIKHCKLSDNTKSNRLLIKAYTTVLKNINYHELLESTKLNNKC